MTQSMRRIAAAVLVSCAAAAGCSAGSGDLPRFHQVNKNIYRGAQPTDAGLAQLKERGVKTVLNLRVDDALHDREAERVEALGMRYVSVPVSRFIRPSEEEVERSLAVINDPENWPVFVHCKHGKDRTGAIVACYRIRYEGWTGARAQREADEIGMGVIEVGKKGYVADYAARYENKPAQAPSIKPEPSALRQW